MGRGGGQGERKDLEEKQKGSEEGQKEERTCQPVVPFPRC